MLTISRGSPTRLRRTVVAGASVSFLLLTAMFATVTGSQAATAHAASRCKIVVVGAPWTIKTHLGPRSGNRYTITGFGFSCSAARPSVVKFTHEKNQGLGATLNGPPPGLKCHSFSTSDTGDKLVYAGICGHATGYKPPAFGWGPKLAR